MTFFLVIALFNDFCLSYLTHDKSYSYFWHTIHPLYAHPHAVFAFLHLALCSRVTVNTAHTIYFVLIHNCTNSLSSLHIFVHHCAFCASLHTKTSPGRKVDSRLELDRCYI